ncbi:uncharacterized protein [Henckelia pumila]|uniref:uncharacterized protein n=1 Tax=Henckelia pumila TaxID=405737 RepID=UPI003C6E8847
MDEYDSIYVKFDDAMFGRPQGSRHLYKYLKEANRADSISFVDPGHIPTCPIDRDGSHLSQHIANQLEAVCRDSICLIPYNTGYHWILTIVNEDKNMIYLLDSTTNRCPDEEWKKIVTNGVKMYNASRGIPRGPLFKQLTGNIKQSGSVECEFCVMKYMKDIVECENLHLDKMLLINESEVGICFEVGIYGRLCFEVGIFGILLSKLSVLALIQDPSRTNITTKLNLTKLEVNGANSSTPM